MSATFTNLSGLTTVSWMLWAFRALGGSWTDQTPMWACDFLAASNRGLEWDARNSGTSIEVVRTSSAATYYQGLRNPADPMPEGRWVLVGVDSDLGSATAPNLYIDGVLQGQSVLNNTYSVGSMGASVVVELRNPALNQYRDGVLIPKQLSALEWGRLAQLNPLR
jgi:hypothetical protein